MDRVEERMLKLEENQTKLWEEIRELREDQKRLWENTNKLWEEFGRLRKYVESGFKDLRRAIGVTYEDHTASMLEVMLHEMGYKDAAVEKKYLIDDGEIVEINLFCEKPLLVGEAALNIDSVDKAAAEVEKLLKRARLAEKIYYEKPSFTILAVSTTTPEAGELLRKLSREHGIKIVVGMELEEYVGL